MIKLSLGIRKKIIFGFYLMLFLIIATTISAVAIVREAQDKFIIIEVIDDFLNTTLEVRRFEKNYFLYKEESSFAENQQYLAELEEFFTSNKSLFFEVFKGNQSSELDNALTVYKTNMCQLHDINMGRPVESLGIASPRAMEENVRAAGKKITDIAEQSAREERIAIQKLLATTGRVLFFSMVILIAIGVGMATYLGRGIVRSLKILEEHTGIIAKGEFVTSPDKVKDEEIVTIFRAFNRMNNELRIRQRQLVQSEKLASLGTLLSGVAHELNNPLSNISSSAQILSEELEDADIEFKQGLVRQIVEQSERAGDIVRMLLEFARARDFNITKLNLKELVEATNILVRGQTPSNVEIIVDISPDIEVMADKQRLQQVFLNLVKNAIDALRGEGNIWISAKNLKRDNEPGEVEIMIEDDGPGISEEIIPKIFDPFFTTKDVGHGSGLGLYIVHDIITSLNGSIHLDSRPNEGTTFVIWLPEGKEEEHESEEIAGS